MKSLLGSIERSLHPSPHSTDRAQALEASTRTA
jgi:hypothetical protein